MYTIRTL